MASLKDMRVRIASTKATQKITKAMQMVAASKLRRAQAVAEAARPYARNMAKVLGNIARGVGDLLPRNLSVQVFRALLENAASEQGARMTAMDNATRNAGEMIRKQTLTYNRTRQAMITKELIEIISGAEAL